MTSLPSHLTYDPTPYPAMAFEQAGRDRPVYRTLEYMADQEGVLRQVYDLAGLELTPAAEASLLGYLAENPRHQHGRVIYDLEGVFEVDVARLRERFQFYYDRYPVRWED